MSKLKTQLSKLNKNLNILRERKAKAAGNAPLDLLNDIEDHVSAIELFRQAIKGEITEETLRDKIAPLNLSLGPGEGVITGDITGSVVAMGKGAQVIINQAQSVMQEAQEREAFETGILAEAIARVAQNLQNLISPFTNKRGDSTTTFNIARTDSLISNGRVAGNPYKSLLDYRISDAPLFFGRRAAIKELMTYLKPGDLTILHAESGSGKTSLLQAGLASRLLARGHLPILIRPWNQDPTLAIKRAFIPNLNKTPGLAEAPLVDFLHQVDNVLGQSASLYIFLDQFEEFFTQLGPNKRENFIEDLGKCLEDESLSVSWLLALRDDYFGQIATFSPRIRHPFEQQYLLRRLSYEEAKQVIIKPAKLAKVEYEESLIPQILIDLTPDEGLLSPPELQLVCSALFDAKPENEQIIKKSLYETLGGSSGILRHHLHQVLRQKFSKEDRKIAYQILEAMVTSEKKRALRTPPQLMEKMNVDEITVSRILTQLIDNRLVRVNEGEQLDEEGTPTTTGIAYELAHDYLLEEIKLDPETQTRKAAHEMLAREVLSYKRFGSLLANQELDVIQTQRPFLNLTPDETELLNKSQAARDYKFRRRIFIGVLVFVSLLIVTVIAMLEGYRARAAERIAIARRLAADATNLIGVDNELGLQLALAGVEQEQGLVPVQNTVRQALLQIRPRQVISSEAGPIFSAAWSPDEQQIAIGLANGDIQIRDVASGQIISTLSRHTQPVRHLAYNPAGDRLASGSASVAPLDFFDPADGLDGEALLWNPKSGEFLGNLEGHVQGVFGLAWSPDGSKLVTASAGSSIKIWDASSKTVIKSLDGHSNKVRWVDWHPSDNKLVSAGNNGEIFIWDIENASIEKSLSGHQGEVFGVNWSPLQGDYIASAGVDGRVYTWDATTGQALDLLPNHRSFVRSVTWHPAGHRLASASFGDNKIIIWNIQTGEPIMTLTGHKDWIRQVTWNKDGSQLISVSDDSTIRIWDIDSIPSLTVLEGHLDDPNHIAWHPNPEERLLASAGKDSYVHIWNTENGHPLATLVGHTGFVWSTAWKPDGTQLISNADDGKIFIWNFPPSLASNILINQPMPPIITITQKVATLEGHAGTVFDAIWHPNGEMIASAGADQSIRLWSGQPITQQQVLLGHTDSVQEIDFSPDGRKLASASADKSIIIWDVNTGEVIQTIEDNTDTIWDVEFSPDGTYLAAASSDKTVRVWNINTGEALHPFPHARSVASVAWNNESNIVASTSDDGIIRLWNIEHSLIPSAELRGHNSGIWNVAWSPDNSRIATAGADDLILISHSSFEDVLNVAKEFSNYRKITPAELEHFISE